MKIYSILTMFLIIGLMSSCGDDAAETSTLNLNLTGLEDLGDNFAYEGWIMVDGSPKTTGVFNVDGSGNLSKSSFDLAKEDLDVATAFILTIEPSPDNDPGPSSTHIIAGDFSGNSASVTVDHSAALGSDFSSVAGDYILATPTDSDDTNEASGIWFLNNSTGTPEVGLNLPTLPAGWVYEGWAVINGTPVTTGTFTSATGADNAAPFSVGGPPFPGEDFLMNAPAGLSFPTDITGGKAVISIEPSPDNSAAPFTLKPLVGDIPSGAAVHSVLSMGANLSFPTGTVSR